MKGGGGKSELAVGVAVMFHMKHRVEPTALKVAAQLPDIPKLIVGHLLADAPGNLQEQVHVLGRKAVVAAALENKAPAGPTSQFIDFT